MSLIKYHRGHSLLDDFRKEINQLCGATDNSQGLGNHLELSESSWMPLVDIKEDSEQFSIKADVPGVKAKDVSVFIDDNHRLVLKGERHSESRDEKDSFVRIERSSGSFYRAFALPDNIDTDSIQAKVSDGLLNVVIPKKQKAASREIPVSE